MAGLIDSTPIVFAVFIVLIFTCFLSNLFNSVQPTPFLDEIFHVPQAKAYCSGNYSRWDTKITTPPGLYVLSTAILKLMSFLLRSDMCTTAGLRMINTVAAIINMILICLIHQERRPKSDTRPLDYKKEITFYVSIGTFPVLYFFSFLYYTDPVATGLVLATYLLDLEKHYFSATFTGFLAICVRQTNIVWVAFIGFQSFARILMEEVESTYGPPAVSLLNSTNYFKLLRQTLVKTWNEKPEVRHHLMKNIFKCLCGYSLIGVCFLVFLVWNNGLVVGDRSAHTAVINIPQLFYYSLFTVLFCAPHVAFHSKDFILWVYCHKKYSISFVLISILIVHFDTLVHPYLLADNRHYTFYIWKRLYERHFLMRYALIPVYMLGFFVMCKMLIMVDIFFCIGYFIFTFICLVPQKLLEFRYFIVPYLFLRMHYYPTRVGHLTVELAISCCINYFTFHLFSTRTFFWPDSDEAQRFIW